MTGKTGLCPVCGRIGSETCILCGKLFCERHVNGQGLCPNCARGKQFDVKRH